MLPKSYIQFEFRKHITNNIALCLVIWFMLDSHICSMIVMLDYSQAFDSISYELLLVEMKYYGCEDNKV